MRLPLSFYRFDNLGVICHAKTPTNGSPARHVTRIEMIRNVLIKFEVPVV
jgi:hypothetical protein